jgi:hypothetical protein
MAGNLDQAAITNELQGELRDLLCLAVVGDHVRWVLASIILPASGELAPALKVGSVTL